VNWRVPAGAVWMGHPLVLVATASGEITLFGEVLAKRFAEHPSARDVRSPPGTGDGPGARVLGEFGRDRTRSGPNSAKNNAGTSAITKASDRGRVVLARVARHRR